MELEPHVNTLREQLAVAAEAGGDDARALAQRLTAPLDAAVRLMLLDVLASAAAEVTAELAPGSVELRLRGGSDPEFVVTPPPAETDAVECGRAGGCGRRWRAPWPARAPVARINLRLPDQLKGRVEEAAAARGPVGQRLARPGGGRRRRPRRDRHARRPGRPPQQPALHGMGAVAVAEFATPEPIDAVVDLVVGDVRVAAGDRADTVVEVRPSDSGRRADVTAAEQARVDYDDGRAAGQDHAALDVLQPLQRRRGGGRPDPASGRLAPDRLGPDGVVPLHRVARRLPAEDGRRRHPRRARGRRPPDDRRRRDRRGARDRRRPDSPPARARSAPARSTASR